MAEGIKNKVAIIGMGCTKFGEHFSRSHESLASEAFQEAIKDAGIKRKILTQHGFQAALTRLMWGKAPFPWQAH